MLDKPIMTVIILSYNSDKYIFQSIDSVLIQNYDNIQLIISDDCSIHFDKRIILSYIDRNKKENIKETIICKNDRNLGTVKNINAALKYSKGKYIKLLAADDQLYSSNVLSEFVHYLDTTGLMITTSTCAVYDEEFKKIKYLYPESINIKTIKKLNPEKLYRKLAVSNIIGGVGACMRKELIIKYSLFDDKYTLTEDLPTWLILSRSGVNIGYMDMITVKYRLNGISNGEVSPYRRILRDDLIKIIDNEILPNKDMLTFYGRREVKFIRMNMKFEGFTLKKLLSLFLFFDVILFRKCKEFNLYMRRIIDGKLSTF